MGHRMVSSQCRDQAQDPLSLEKVRHLLMTICKKRTPLLQGLFYITAIIAHIDMSNAKPSNSRSYFTATRLLFVIQMHLGAKVKSSLNKNLGVVVDYIALFHV